MADKKLIRIEINTNLVLVICFCVFMIALNLTPIDQLMWFSNNVNNVLKWFSDNVNNVLYWFSDNFLPRFSELVSSVILTLADIKCLALYIGFSFFFSCWSNWNEVKLTFQNVWIPLEKATIAIFQLISSPQFLIQYAMFAIIVNIFPQVVLQVSQGLLKANKLA